MILAVPACRACPLGIVLAVAGLLVSRTDEWGRRGFLGFGTAKERIVEALPDGAGERLPGLSVISLGLSAAHLHT